MYSDINLFKFCFNHHGYKFECYFHIDMLFSFLKLAKEERCNFKFQSLPSNGRDSFCFYNYSAFVVNYDFLTIVQDVFS